MGLRPDGIIGHSLGEVACGYADGCLSQEEAVLTAYWRGQCIKEASIPPGAMAAVGGCPLWAPPFHTSHQPRSPWGGGVIPGVPRVHPEQWPGVSGSSTGHRPHCRVPGGPPAPAHSAVSISPHCCSSYQLG